MRKGKGLKTYEVSVSGAKMIVRASSVVRAEKSAREAAVALGVKPEGVSARLVIPVGFCKFEEVRT